VGQYGEIRHIGLQRGRGGPVAFARFPMADGANGLKKLLAIGQNGVFWAKRDLLDLLTLSQ
jgi:hypothetical protein